jgi:hypothetical protein
MKNPNKVGRPKGANKKLVGIWLPNDLNDELHQIIVERGMSLSGVVEVAIRNYLHPTAQKNPKAPKLLKSRGYDHFRDHMRRNIKNAGGQLVLTANEVKGEVSDSGILYRTSQRDAYLARLMADEILNVRCEFGSYIFETVDWQQQKKSDDAKRELEARAKAYQEVELAAAPEAKLEAPTKTKPTPETPAKPEEAEPTKEDLEAHKKYLELAAKAEADDDQRRREEQERKDEETMIRYRKMMLGLKD